VPEGLSTAEVGNEIGEHSHHAGTHQSAGRHGRVISITEAVGVGAVLLIFAVEQILQLPGPRGS
jgi:hypothetical protein